MAKILEKRSLTPVTTLFRVDAPLVAAAAQARAVRHRPCSRRRRTYSADDRRLRSRRRHAHHRRAGSRRHDRQLGALEVGDDILDLVGPLGMAVEVPAGGHVVGVGGGFGAAALWCLMSELSARGDRTTIILGAREKELLILTDELTEVCDNLELCTDDGSAGFKGFVTDRLAQLIDGDGPGRPDSVVAIGPMPMMRAVTETTRDAAIPTLVSLDPLMIDGTGMCGGCRVTVNNEVKFACVDGPFFDAHQVDFEEAVRRNKMYVPQEQSAKDRATCRSARIGQD